MVYAVAYTNTLLLILNVQKREFKIPEDDLQLIIYWQKKGNCCDSKDILAFAKLDHKCWVKNELISGTRPD